jgi:alginate O-acetyltransferase complex protein AlgI
MILFNSYEFAIFFSCVYGIYLLSNHRWQNRWLLIASYIFYGTWNWKFLGLIWTSTVIDFFCGKKIHETRSRNRRKAILLFSIGSNLSILGFFKYYNFFAGSFENLMHRIGWTVDALTLQIVLPVGISFYTFQTLSYTIDIYRKEIEPTDQFFDFALFVTFFPQLVAGPIERAKNLLPQFLNQRVVTWEKIKAGAWLIFWGLFKKVFIADSLAKIVDAVFSSQNPTPGTEVLMALYAFAFQIYGDFSGYSDIARGISKLLGFELMLNFKMPYFSRNIREFWRRWHISLSTWLKDYLYISMGGSRISTLMTYRNLFLTMAIGGLWHGAAWTFVFWGIFHGLMLILHRLCDPLLFMLSPRTPVLQRLWRTLCIFITFHLVCLGWLMFRSQTLAQVVSMLNALVFNFVPTRLSYQYLTHILLCISLMIIIQIFKERSEDMNIVLRWPAWIRGGIFLIIFISLVIGGVEGGKEFIYFQF